MISDNIQDNGEDIIFTGTYMEAYIPEFYFEGKLAEDHGTSISVFGLFNIRMFDSKNKPMKLETFNVPSMIHIYPSDTATEKLQLISGPSGEEEQYRVAKFYKGNVLMKSSIQQDSTNVELFLDVLLRGKIPNTIPYSQILDIWQKNLDLNGVRLGVTSTVLEIIIAEVYRNEKKPEEKFAKIIGKDPKVSEHAYKTANIREICARNSAFAAMTFEDMDSMITTSLNIKQQGREETMSPIENIIKM